MAQLTQDNSLLLESVGKEVKELVVGEKGGSEEVAEAGQSDATASTTPSVAEAGAHVAKASSTASSTDAQSSTTPSRPSLVALNSITSSTTSITPVAPHPKRFSAVNINKKFLEKNTSASFSNASSSSAAKAGSAAARPPIQSTSSHSRLVAAKLTANPVVSSSPGGWSRPSSVAPSPGTTTASPISTSPLPSVVVAHPANSAPQLPHAGKVIQPQPRAQLVQSQPTLKESAPVKPVWGHVKPPTVVRPDIAPSDFPTAAEVAHNANSAMLKQVKADEAKVTSDTAAKQLRLEEADAFRGIHLDPNAHHWDEMEEDDDNFLDGVIEFGDGRQYKIESSESQETGLSTEAPSKSGDSTTYGPVAKEERFVDDFDRSWPKSRTSPASVSRDVGSTTSASHSVTPTNVSPVVSHAAHSPQDSSRVLFNERSNRLEPYSQSHRPNNAPFSAKRPGFPDVPHADVKGSAQNIQVLQKPAGAHLSRSRRFSNVSNSGGSYAGGSVNGYTGDRNREPHRRDGPPASPRLPRDLPPHVQDNRDQDRGRRVPNGMGPPPLPPHVAQGGRQLPPHLSQSPTALPSPRLPSRDSRRVQPEPPLSATSPPSAHIPAQSPAVSHKSLVSPAVLDKALPPLAVPDLDVARKDVMHSAAERAKQRRLEEEAEREAQKDRARKKAAELEERMKAIEAEKENARQREKEAAAEAARIIQEKEKEREREKEAIAVIENAVRRTEKFPRPHEQKPSEPVSSRAAPKAVPVAGPPQTPFAQPFERKPGIQIQRAGPILSRPLPPSVAPPTPASETESWRARMAPVPPTPRQQIQARSSAATNFVAAGPSAAEQVETIASSQDDLEIVDFSDLGKFAGVSEDAEPTQVQSTDIPVAPTLSNKQSRPVASDFFDAPITLHDEVPASKKADFGAWRRRVSQEVNELPTVQIPEPKKAPEPMLTGKAQPQELEPALHLDGSMVSTKEPLAHIDQSPGHHVVHVSPTSAQRTPRVPPFKEAAMSALDDTMSRIKGALLHAHDPSKEITESSVGLDPPTAPIGPTAHQQGTSRPPAVNNRWVPPALRPRYPGDLRRTIEHEHDHDEPREVFLVTMSQPPPSPRPAQLSIKFPFVSKPVGPIPRKQLLAFSRPPFPARLHDVMTFDPPVYDIRRDWSLNDVLFRKQPPLGFKGKWKYRVWLPRVKGPRPGVNGVVKSFVRPTVADGASTWRKASTLKVEAAEEPQTLDTVSRSPPPEASPPLTMVASIPKPYESSMPKALDINPAVKAVTRSQPKMPQGSAVAFVRDSRIDVVQADPRPLVNFIVGSQLDEAKLTTPESSVSKALTNTAPATVDVDNMPIFASIESESRSSGNMADSILVTPPSHHSASWARSSISLSLKDSPARAPDPEHLKAVWSQPPNKAGLHPVNSLEGIADDLTGLPFTIQDVKSEDGETPPPSLTNAPSRILPFEVSRAFQQVPTSSVSTNQPASRPNFSPPSTQAPVARPATTITTTTAASPPYHYPPASPANMRPPYMAYPSAMMGHPPGSIVYGPPMTTSPIQRRMQVNAGHTPLYSQPMWMTMPGTPQGMRPIPSPYPAQMMPYPSPGYPQMPQPLSNMMPGTPQGQNSGRGRGVPVMSPSMSHAHPQPVQPMYGGSPVVLHAVPVPQNHGYMPMPGAGRGQQQNGQMPPPSLPQQSPQHTLHPQPPNGFNAGSTPPFARPSW